MWGNAPDTPLFLLEILPGPTRG